MGITHDTLTAWQGTVCTLFITEVSNGIKNSICSHTQSTTDSLMEEQTLFWTPYFYGVLERASKNGGTARVSHSRGGAVLC